MNNCSACAKLDIWYKVHEPHNKSEFDSFRFYHNELQILVIKYDAIIAEASKRHLMYVKRLKKAKRSADLDLHINSWTGCICQEWTAVWHMFRANASYYVDTECTGGIWVITLFKKLESKVDR
jgi:hypothetical protein